GKETEEKEAEGKPIIEYGDFDKCEFRVAEIVEASFVEKSKKLLRFQVKIGNESRQILSGIRKYYPNPEELIGQKVMAIVNLAPRKMAGMESYGMLLCAEDSEGKLSLVGPHRDVLSGAEIC
ncbi:MAG: methionine--tRNA ligase subunit beta, partial [Lachnospiraceae bacterium]|nr:methionine--tRNA ligase subunit beta [Lachnospiraceae bacterium]